MLFRKPPIWNLQPGLVARPWREHWRGVKAVFPFWEPGGRSIYPVPRCTRWSLNNGAARRLTRYGPAVYFPGNNSNEVETADGNPILFDSGEPYTIALLILWTEDPGNEGIFRSGSANTGNWLWMLSGGRLWGRQANVNSPASGSGPLITAGWHTLARVWDGREVRQYVDGLRTNTTAVTATGSWPLYRFGYQFTGSEALDEAYVPFFGAFGAAWDDAMVARWSANPARHAVAGDGCGVRGGGRWWRGPAGRGAAAGGHHRCWLGGICGGESIRRVARRYVHDAGDPGLQLLSLDGGDDRDAGVAQRRGDPVHCL